jgi:hypothetical protein
MALEVILYKYIYAFISISIIYAVVERKETSEAQ